MSGKLYIVATPIGNLKDISFHAIDVLKSVDLIACENPMHTTKLLQHYNIKKPLDKFFDHNEKEKSKYLFQLLSQGKDIALVSDAGTPLISDPGFNLVRLLKLEGIQVIPIAGPCAMVAALSASGLETNEFSFEGFLPAKQSLRVKCLQRLVLDTRTLIFYESPHRIQQTLLDSIQVFGLMRIAVIARELTKQFETIKQLPLGQLYQWVHRDRQDRGEIVFLIQGAESRHRHHEMTDLLKVLMPYLHGKKLVEVVREYTGVSKQTIYKAIERINQESG
ncbi:MAG: 16S rRNA (cytidine(1402)-2'-O)-methyltransferase [Gammaproteobacteria bacterium]|nr:16S rRNA (cytidine(1402)-2'-O)-methyltransferase [Gammaproteobacteria bacterium]